MPSARRGHIRGQIDKKTLKDVEVRTLADGTASYIFRKRLNPAKGTYAGFADRFKLKLVANTDAEATSEAKKLADRLEQLQRTPMLPVLSLWQTGSSILEVAQPRLTLLPLTA
jgi:hypothetical protein